MELTQTQIDAYKSTLDIFKVTYGPQEWDVHEDLKDSFARFMLSANDYLLTTGAEGVPYWITRKLMEVIDKFYLD